MTTLGESFIFFHMPRTGGTSIVHWLMKCLDVWQPIHGEVEYKRSKRFCTTVPHAGPVHLSQEVFLKEHKFWFAFIRNPFDWYVSKWAMKFKIYEDYPDFKAWLRPLLIEDNIRSISKWVALNMRFAPNIFPGGPKQWAEIIDQEKTPIPDWDFDKELNPSNVKFDVGYMTHRYLQVTCGYPLVYFEKFPNWIDRHDELCLMDKVYKFEDGIEKGLKDALGIEIKDFPIKNTSVHKSYQEYYDDELRELVEYKDRFIFKTYGYTF